MSQKETNQMKSVNQVVIGEEHLELIKGEFSSADAKEILLQLFADKIKYHQIRNLGSIERFGEEDGISSKRLPELKKHVQKIHDLFGNGGFPGASIKIQATIHIEITE
jgi:hypothetical protein